MVKKQIYSPWAFTADEDEKARCNYEIFKELQAKYKVYRRDTRMLLTNGVDCNFEDYDIVIGRSAQYCHALYHIYKNAPGLTTEELALLCDDGNLCFGYSMQGNIINVSED